MRQLEKLLSFPWFKLWDKWLQIQWCLLYIRVQAAPPETQNFYKIFLQTGDIIHIHKTMNHHYKVETIKSKIRGDNVKLKIKLSHGDNDPDPSSWCDHCSKTAIFDYWRKPLKKCRKSFQLAPIWFFQPPSIPAIRYATLHLGGSPKWRLTRGLRFLK